MDGGKIFCRIHTSHHHQRTFYRPTRRSTKKRVTSAKNVLLALVMGALMLSSGCYHYRVTAPDPRPASPYQHETIHILFWGFLQPTVTAGNCSISNALDQVTVTNNYGYVIITFITLGIWAPMDVEWQCAKEASPNIEEQL